MSLAQHSGATISGQMYSSCPYGQELFDTVRIKRYDVLIYHGHTGKHLKQTEFTEVQSLQWQIQNSAEEVNYFRHVLDKTYIFWVEKIFSESLHGH